MKDNLLSWNFPNLVSVMLMIVVLWAAIGAVSHTVWRKGGSGGKPKANASGYGWAGVGGAS